MKNKYSLNRLLCIVLAVALALGGGIALAQSDQSGTTERPVYLDVVPVAGSENSILDEGLIAAMAREALSASNQAMILMRGQKLPPNVRVLRILYIIHRQSRENGVAFAASASTQLLRTADNDRDGVLQTNVVGRYSAYSGLQQTLVQGPDAERARMQLREAFRDQLQRRIRSAFGNNQSR